MADEDNITIARLDGAARKHLDDNTPRQETIDALRAISSNPALLGAAAGSALGSWRANKVGGRQGDVVAELLIAAGGDVAVVEEVAGEVTRRSGRSGIGNP